MKKETKIVVVVVVALLAIVLIYLILSKSVTQNTTTQKKSVSSAKVMNKPVAQTKEATKETKKLITEVAKKGEKNVKTISVPSTIKTASGTEIATATEMKVVTIAEGASAIDVNTGQVVTETGKAVDNSADAGSGEAPQESVAVSKDQLPDSTIKLDVTSSSFTPKEFTVNRGQAVSLAVTNANTSTFSEVFRFDDPSLKAVVIGLAKGETKTIVFNAPTKAGKYTFYSDMFNHRDLGAVGTMIVK